jgi:hypothetical protein
VSTSSIPIQSSPASAEENWGESRIPSAEITANAQRICSGLVERGE